MGRGLEQAGVGAVALVGVVVVVVVAVLGGGVAAPGGQAVHPTALPALRRRPVHARLAERGEWRGEGGDEWGEGGTHPLPEEGVRGSTFFSFLSPGASGLPLPPACTNKALPSAHPQSRSTLSMAQPHSF